MRKLSSWEVMVVMVLLRFLEDTKPLRSGDAEGRRRRKKKPPGSWGGDKRQQQRIAQRLLYKDNKRRNRQKKDGSKAHGQERQTGEREVVVGEEVGFALF